MGFPDLTNIDTLAHYDTIQHQRAYMPFTQIIKNQLAHEVAGHCSSPTCRVYTGIPNNFSHLSNTGDAAHIKAENPGFARYDHTQSPEERNCSSNGIWLCPNCHRIIDRHEELYPPEILHHWKNIATEEVQRGLSRAKTIIYGSELEQQLIKARNFLAPYGRLANRLNLLQYNKQPFSQCALVDHDLIKEIFSLERQHGMNVWNNSCTDWCSHPEINAMQQEMLRITRHLASFFRQYYNHTPTTVDFTLIYLQDGTPKYSDSKASAMGRLKDFHQEFSNELDKYGPPSIL